MNIYKWTGVLICALACAGCQEKAEQVRTGDAVATLVPAVVAQRLEFPALSLGRAGETTYKIDSVPGYMWWCAFTLQFADEAARRQAGATQVAVTILNADAKTIASWSGPLNERWSSTGSHALPGNMSGFKLVGQNYRVVITVANPTPQPLSCIPRITFNPAQLPNSD